MRRLWVQLTIAFALVTILSVATAAFLANRRAGADFRSFLAQAQVQQLDLAPRLADYYAARGNWAGVEALLADIRGMGPGGMGPGGMGMMRGPLNLILADSGGEIVYRTSGARNEAHLSADQLRDATPILVDGRPAGYLLATAATNAALSLAAQRFLDQLNQALLQAGILAGGLGLLLGVLIARSLAAPLDQLTRAAHRLAGGDLTQRAPVTGPAEVAGAAAAFNSMAASLEYSEALRRRMIADIAHELRTPLTVIQGNLRALLDDVFPLQKTEIATIYDESLVLGRLVADLRELTLAEAGQLTLQRTPVDLAAAIARARSLFSAAATEKQVTLTIDSPPRPPTVLADPDRLAQIFNNLLSNALRHSPAGAAVVVTVADAGALTRIAVTDHGPGIAADELPYVFDRFWRADRGRSRAQGGSGLGLAIARQLVLAHGGDIGVVSEPGQGASFWFTLPIAAEV